MKNEILNVKQIQFLASYLKYQLEENIRIDAEKMKDFPIDLSLIENRLIALNDWKNKNEFYELLEEFGFIIDPFFDIIIRLLMGEE